MHVARLSLVDFRSYAAVDVDLSPGSVVFVGANGQGKTNLIEAIDYLARLDSHRVSSDAPLVRAGADQAIVRARVAKADRTALIELEITPGKANRARVNQNALPRVRDLLGIVQAITFSPEDLALVKGDPSDRRRFLDGLLVMSTPRLAGVKSDYDRVLKQRNTLLKSAGRRSNVDISTLEIWDDNLVKLGSQIVSARLKLLDGLAPHMIRTYADVAVAAAPDRQSVSATYRSAALDDPDVREVSDVAEALAAQISARRREELERGVSLVGPHRDEVVLSIGDLPARGYASHGESWSLALALRLASYELLRVDDDPILILDDVFAELDTRRREQLASLVSSAEQVLITAAVEQDVPAALMGSRFDVRGGEVTGGRT